MPIPKPKLPKLDLSDEVDAGFETEDVGVGESKEEESGIGREKLVTSFSKLLGFVAAIGLPQEIMKIKIEEYSRLAEETGVTEALLDCIEYYFPDVEMSPAVVLAVTGIAFASAVISDRMEIKKKYEKRKKLEGKPSAQQIKQNQEAKKQGAEVS